MPTWLFSEMLINDLENTEQCGATTESLNANFSRESKIGENRYTDTYIENGNYLS